MLVLLLPFPLVLAANWKERPPTGPGVWNDIARVAGQTTWAALGLIAGACMVVGVGALIEAAVDHRHAGLGTATYGAVFAATGVAAGSVLLEPTRSWLARVMPIDPRSALDATALVLTIALVGSQLASQLVIDQLTEQARNGVALEPIDLILQEVPFLLAALFGVGLFIRRSPTAALVRLGLVRPTVWQVLLALAAAGAFYALGNGIDGLGHLLTPGIARKVDAANQRLFGHLGDPVGIATIALSAGICEEALFRGALQPRLGLLWTALVFAAVHTQYGLSLDAAAVLVLALGLGLLRWVSNTTTTSVCHVAYNTLVGVGISGTLLLPAVLVEAALIVAGLGAFLTGRLGSLRTAQ
jgi:uncharacterized protein